MGERVQSGQCGKCTQGGGRIETGVKTQGTIHENHNRSSSNRRGRRKGYIYIRYEPKEGKELIRKDDAEKFETPIGQEELALSN